MSERSTVTTDVNWGAVVVCSMCRRFTSPRTKSTSRAFRKPRSELVYTDEQDARVSSVDVRLTPSRCRV